jgi:hypothetical protein
MTNDPTIQDLVVTFLADEKEPNIVGFVDQLFPLAHEWKHLRIELRGPEQLQVQLADGEPMGVPLLRAKGKLRMMCARLAVICEEQLGGPPPLYGGDALLAWPLPGGGTMSCRVLFQNTPGDQWLAIRWNDSFGTAHGHSQGTVALSEAQSIRNRNNELAIQINREA